jgi:hypothetical protein
MVVREKEKVNSFEGLPRAWLDVQESKQSRAPPVAHACNPTLRWGILGGFKPRNDHIWLTYFSQKDKYDCLKLK